MSKSTSDLDIKSFRKTTLDQLYHDNATSSPEHRDDSDRAEDLGEADPGVATTELNYHERRWKRLNKHYSDAYLELFNRSTISTAATTCSDSAFNTDDAHESEFAQSQIGVVIWTPSEKAKFFNALSKCGRHDLPRISQIIGSKSQIEVKAFIELLYEAFADRQRFERETKNVSHAEIPAAIEISLELDSQLEAAADALEAMQEGYDFAAAQHKSKEPWLIDIEAAREVDKDADVAADESRENLETDDEAMNHGRDGQISDGYKLFHLTNWIDISERVFMNSPPDQLHQHWSIVAEDGQTPSMTHNTVMDFYNLTVSLTQRLLQTAIWLAKCRVRALTIGASAPAKVLTRADVHAAIDIVGMRTDAWDYWARLPRRRGLTVYSTSHEKGQQSKPVLTPFENEQLLLQMSMTRQSRSRSRSTVRSQSADRTSSAPSDLQNDVDEEQYPDTDADTSHINDVEDGEDEAIREREGSHDTGLDESEEEESSDNDDIRTDIDIDVEGSTPSNRRKRKLLLEEAQDAYMERMDQRNSRRHEAELRQALGESPMISTKDEDGESDGVRPKTLRKTNEELSLWSCAYKAEWE